MVENDDKLVRVRHLLVTVFLSNLGTIIVTPAITDITMSALCPAQDQCSLAIYLSGFQQAVCPSSFPLCYMGWWWYIRAYFRLF